jgi:cytokinesis protein
MKRKQAALASPTSSAGDVPGSPTAGAMDDLIAKLRAAKPEAKDQRDRRRRARLRDKHAVRVASGAKIPDLTDLIGQSGSGTDTANGMLSPMSEVSQAGDSSNGPAEDSDADIADRAANLLQDLDDDESKDPVSGTPRDSIRNSRRRETALEERAKRRQRRQQARSEISIASSARPGEGEDEDGDRMETDGPPSPQKVRLPPSPEKNPPPITIVHPPSPDGSPPGSPKFRGVQGMSQAF